MHISRKHIGQISGTDPNDDTSLFVVEDMDLTTIYWTPEAGRKYSIYWTDNLAQSFIKIGEAAYPGNSYTDTLHDQSQRNFY